MATRILVPLDGSPLAEQALPHVKKFAAEMRACEIELFYVIDPATLADLAAGVLPPSYLHCAKEQANEYLEAQARTLTSARGEVHQLVSIGPPAQVILDHLEASPFDYVVMATHGRSGFARAVLGSVTDRVIREGAAPVITFHPRVASSVEERWPGDDPSNTECIDMGLKAT